MECKRDEMKHRWFCINTACFENRQAVGRRTGLIRATALLFFNIPWYPAKSYCNTRKSYCNTLSLCKLNN
jgi:hypothetical protein